MRVKDVFSNPCQNLSLQIKSALLGGSWFAFASLFFLVNCQLGVYAMRNRYSAMTEKSALSATQIVAYELT